MPDIDANCVKLPMRDLIVEEKLLTPLNVAKRIQINERTVLGWLREGHLRVFKIGKTWRVSVKDLEDFLEAVANKPSSKPRSEVSDRSQDRYVSRSGRLL